MVKAAASPVYHDAYAVGELIGDSTSGGERGSLDSSPP
jgi:hypothetical protein